MYFMYFKWILKIGVCRLDNRFLKDVEQACIKFNCADIQNGGRRLEKIK